MFLTTVVVKPAFPNIKKASLSTGFDNIYASGEVVAGEGPEGKSY